MIPQFDTVYRAVREGQPASIGFEADNVLYTRDFRPDERLILLGGGCSEHAALLQAHRLIGSGAQRCVHVDLSNDVAADEGMVCGGQMDVLILTDGVAAQEAGI